MSVADTDIPGPDQALHLRLYVPEAAASPGPGLIYLHGGGLVAGSVDSHDAIARSLALAGHCRVVSVDYRLAPEHRFPAAIEDACAAADWILGHPAAYGLIPGRIGICGDSAGATLAIAACSDRAAREHPGLALLLLLCPITDYAGDTASRQAFATGYLLDRETLSEDLALYLPAGGDAADPRISPLRANAQTGIPHACIHTAEYDPVRDEGAAYSQRLRASGIPTTYDCHPGMIHLFYGLGGLIPAANAAWQAIGESIRTYL
jgi:acetyl esterase/lipase